MIEQNVDTSTSSGKAFFGMLALFAQFENDVRREWQMEGIAKAKAAGVYRGQPKSIDGKTVRELRKDGMSPTAIARALGISRPSVSKHLG